MRSCVVLGRDGPQLCASHPGTGMACSGVVQGSARALIPFEMLVVLVGDALWRVQHSRALERGATSLRELQGRARGRAALALV